MFTWKYVILEVCFQVWSWISNLRWSVLILRFKDPDFLPFKFQPAPHILLCQSILSKSCRCTFLRICQGDLVHALHNLWWRIFGSPFYNYNYTYLVSSPTPQKSSQSFAKICFPINLHFALSKAYCRTIHPFNCQICCIYHRAEAPSLHIYCPRPSLPSFNFFGMRSLSLSEISLFDLWPWGHLSN